MIRQWQEKDSIVLRDLIKNFLLSQESFGSGVLPSENNISYYLLLGYDQIKRNNDPHLLWEESGEILAYLQLGKEESIFEKKYKACEVFALYVRPKVEHRFLGTQLFQASMEYIVRNKYIRFSSTVMLENTRMLKNMFINPAIWPTRVVLEGDVRIDSQFTENGIRPLERQVG